MQKVWGSPTLTTWANLATQSLSLIIVLPLVLAKLDVEEVATWYLFGTFISFQAVFQFGFTPTFTRLISYAMGGSSLADIGKISERDKSGVNRVDNPQPNWATIDDLVSTSSKVFVAIGFLSLATLSFFGTPLVAGSISATKSPETVWMAWMVVCIATGTRLYGSHYISLLQGTNHVALAARWQTLFTLGGILSMIAVMIFTPSILALVVAQQIWVVGFVFANRYLSKRIFDGHFKNVEGNSFSWPAFRVAWPSVWKSGLGVGIGEGFVSALGVYYAQVGSAVGVASYLLGMRLIKALGQFSGAPFYTKIPVLAQLRAQHNHAALTSLAVSGMRLSHLVFISGVVLLGFTGSALLGVIKTDVPFPDAALWASLSIAFFLQRFGAMHIQMYSTTNRIIWHWVNGLQGIIVLSSALVLFPYLGVLGFGFALVLGNLMYATISAFFSYKELESRILTFESKSIGPSILLGLGLSILLAILL